MNRIILSNNDIIFVDDSLKVVNLFNKNDDQEIIFCVINKNSRHYDALFRAKIKEIYKLPKCILNMHYGVPYGALLFTELLHKDIRVVFLLFDDEFFKRRLLTDDSN